MLQRLSLNISHGVVIFYWSNFLDRRIFYNKPESNYVFQKLYCTFFDFEFLRNLDNVTICKSFYTEYCTNQIYDIQESLVIYF